MAEFVPKPGCVICSKCGGWQVLDYTKRNPANKNPIGPLDYRDCDKCEGAGEIRVEPLIKISEPKRRGKKLEVDIDIGIPMPQDEPVASSCWHINKKEVWGKLTCADCGKVL